MEVTTEKCGSGGYLPHTLLKNNPEHYGGNWEIGDFIFKQNLDFYQGNVVKYICRYKKKNGIEDLLKAREYINQLILLEKQK
jgi:hypothetical protein